MATKKTLKKSDLKSRIRDIPDFPKEGIIFKDITTLLKDGEAFKKSIDLLAHKFRYEKIDLVVGVEARGFVFGATLAYKLRVGFVPVRKKGKLPAATKSVEYQLEYGKDVLEIHADAIRRGQRVLLVDDLLAILRVNPFQNPPPCEKLVGDLAGDYSRRINIKHRLVYQVFKTERTVKILRMWTHYE